MRIVSYAMALAFASFRQRPTLLKTDGRYIVPAYNDTGSEHSDLYIKNIEKMSKSRNNPPNYIENLERNHSKRKGRRQFVPPPNQRKTILIPIGVKIPPFAYAASKERGRPKESDSGQFVLETIKNFNFTRIGGYETIKKELGQVAHMMLHPDNYKKYNVRVPKGVLLEGPPGNGKTLLAKCFAGETNCSFVQCSGSEFNEKYIGVGSSRIRELFKFASENQPVVLFIDEFDAIGRRRGEDGSSNGEKDTTLNQLLVLMDGFENIPNMLIMAATNRVDILDPAAIRPGRFDKVIHIPNPDFQTRSEISKIHRESKPIQVDDEEIAQMTSGFSGAMIENLLNEATLWGIRNERLPIDRDMLDDIRQEIIFGTAVMTRNISVHTQKRIAVHETGHLLNALCTDYYDKPIRVSINLSNKNSLGHTVFERDEEDDGIFTKEYLDEKIRVLLGGRAAEEIIYGQSSSSTGSVADLESAFQLTRRMIMEFGMGRHIVYPFLSEDYKKRIDDEIDQYVQTMYNEAKQVILINMNIFNTFVDRLTTQGVLMENEIASIFNEEE